MYVVLYFWMHAFDSLESIIFLELVISNILITYVHIVYSYIM